MPGTPPRTRVWRRQWPGREGASSRFAAEWRLFASNFQPQEGGAEDRTDGELAQLAKTAGVDPSVINGIKAGDDVDTAKATAAAGDATPSGLNAGGKPFVWDGTRALNYQDPTWFTKPIGSTLSKRCPALNKPHSSKRCTGTNSVGFCDTVADRCSRQADGSTCSRLISAKVSPVTRTVIKHGRNG